MSVVSLYVYFSITQSFLVYISPPLVMAVTDWAMIEYISGFYEIIITHENA